MSLGETAPQSDPLPPLPHRTALAPPLLRVKLPGSQARGSASPLPDVSHLGPVLQEPAVRGLVLPARIARVFPQQLDLVCGVSGVPEGVAKILTRACFRLHCLRWRKEW